MQSCFIRARGQTFGPFTEKELCAQIAKGEIPFASWVYVSNQWVLLAECEKFRTAHPEFEPKPKQKPLLSKVQSQDKLAQTAQVRIVVKRQHSRIPYEVDVLAHDQKKVLLGKSMVLSEGGFFLRVRRPVLNVGNKLKVHFSANEFSAFHAVAEIVSVIKGKASGYSMKFIQIAEADRKKLAQFIERIAERSFES